MCVVVSLGVAIASGVNGAWAGDASGTEASPAALREVAVGSPSTVEPWISARMPDSVLDKLEVSFDLALHRVQTLEACAELFAALGTDGVTALSRALYYPVNLRRENGLCRGSIAVTMPGIRPTRLCRRFAHLSDSHAAMILIHEALHLAGLTERPSDPDAMSSGAINRMVTDACALERGQTSEQALKRVSTH